MNRNIGLAILFSVITCGIYQIYWFVVLTDEINGRKIDFRDQPSGIVCFLLTLVTCGIYSIYWAYKIGEKQAVIKRDFGEFGGQDNNILYLILEIFGFNIIVLALAQNEMNKMYPLQNGPMQY